jgi:4-hydroxybenzoate polyprenyltransferase
MSAKQKLVTSPVGQTPSPSIRSLLVKFWHLNRMGRIEGPPLAGLLILAAAALSGADLTLSVWVAALAMTAVCMNYVYLVNGVTDVAEDSINSPQRPLARGDVTVKEGWFYVHLLFALSIIYPLFLHDTWSERIMVWIILAMGFFYSMPPVRFKRFPPLATIYLTINFNLPLIIGYQMATGHTGLPPYLLATVALFLANMPLKDYGDRQGDMETGMGNWVQIVGSAPRLLLLSTALSVAGAVFCYFLLPDLGQYRLVYALLPLMPTANILIHKAFAWDMDQMFTHGVRSLIVLCTAVTLLYYLVG